MQTSTQIDSLKNRVQDVLDEAKKQGASAAKAGLSVGKGLSVNVRMGEVETIEHDCNRGLGLTVYFGQRKGSASSTDLSLKSIQETVRAACSIAKYSSDDEFSGLPAADILATNIYDLNLNHPWALDVEQAIDLGIECETAAREVSTEITNSDGASVDSHENVTIFGNSHGFLEAMQKTRHSTSCSVIAQRGDDMQTNYWYSVVRDANDLEKNSSIGKKAAERALKRLGSRSLKTQTAPILFNPEMAAGLFSTLMGAISGGSLYRNASFLLDRIDTQLFPDFIHIHEQPHLKKALSSSLFDSEGVATKNRDIIANGILKSYLLSTYSARKLGLKTTGNAGGVRNLTIDSGEYNFQAMLSQLGTGLLVTELMGDGINMMTGDYSRGAAGFWVENGQILYPVEGITIAANLKDMYKNLVAVGNDIDLRGNIRTGSVLIEQMSIAA